MKRSYLIGGALYIIIMILGIALLLHDGLDDDGMPNIPLFNERANACYGGGSLAGTCATEADWQCGWSWIRLENGLMTREDFPQECHALLPAAGLE
jgi:hypothetical protein